jgi:hypothetical protein
LSEWRRADDFRTVERLGPPPSLTLSFGAHAVIHPRDPNRIDAITEFLREAWYQKLSFSLAFCA